MGSTNLHADLGPSTRRRSNRTSILPKKFNDHVLNIKVPCRGERDEGFEDEELLFTQEGESTSYVEAPGVKEWDNAMDKERASIERNKMWELVDKPNGFKAIDLK